MSQFGKIYLIPNTLGGESTTDILPKDVMQIACDLRFFAVEEIKSARRLLRKMDREFPIDDSTFHILTKKSTPEELSKMIETLKAGNNLGIISEAGCPGIADPGANLVSLAHQEGIEVKPCVGPSSILMALIASGMNGQEFTFHGYLPKDRKDRVKKIKDFEGQARRTGMTHIFMDTPFRNMHVLDDLLNYLADDTHLCIASNITLQYESIKTMRIVDWRENAYDLSKIPALFLIGKLA
jgi:16S rRNA (cytidine1402-2'-O)-methyltransferase